jgi:hypothetical protein
VIKQLTNRSTEKQLLMVGAIVLLTAAGGNTRRTEQLSPRS